jgi:hypothetical protein
MGNPWDSAYGPMFLFADMDFEIKLTAYYKGKDKGQKGIRPSYPNEEISEPKARSQDAKVR